MASTYLTRTNTGTVTNNKIFTFSAWIKRSKISSGQHSIFTGYVNSQNNDLLYIPAADTLGFWGAISNSQSTYYLTNRVLRDTNAWYHIVLAVDTTQATASDRVKIYINGVQETSFSQSSAPAQNTEFRLAKASNPQEIGAQNAGSTFDGLMSHVHFVDGTAYTPSAFGSTDATTGEWKINTNPSVTHGNNGFFVLKDGNSVTDQSGNSNNFTVAAGTLTDMVDSPSNVFATLNSLVSRTGTLTNCNLTHEGSGATAPDNTISTLGVSSGKWYVEAKILTGNNYNGFGVVTENNPYVNSGTDYLSNSNDALIYAYSDIYRGGGTISGTYATLATNDIVQIAIDADNKFLYFGVNGTWQNSSDPTSGSSGTGALNMTTYLGSDVTFFVAAETGGASNTRKIEFNFGNGYFGTSAIASEGTNASGIGKFEYDVPTGYTALCTKGLNE